MAINRPSVCFLMVLPGFILAGAAHATSAPPPAVSVSTTTLENDPSIQWRRDSMKTREQRLEWWHQARFGMFMHWGVYSGLGGTWRGQPVRGYAEHIQRMLKIPIPVYRAEVAGKFNPTEFDAESWARLAKQAGMGYLVITAKHHDGFAMYDSKVSDYNIVKATPFHRDPMRELKAACVRNGLKFGFYYSHAFDWGDAEAPGNDWDYNNPGGDRLLHGGARWWEVSPDLVPKVRRYVDRKAIPQLLELIRNYHPDILWFDTPQKLPPEENLRIMKAVREAGPDVVINGRLVRGLGDYASTADRPAEFAPHPGDWEGIPTTNESYGYNQNDHSHKPPAHFIQLLAKAAARGGNILLNIGPMGNGRIDPADVAILEGIGKWMKVNGDSIRGTSRTPLPVQAWGESTLKGTTLYLHVFDWPASGHLIVGGLKSNVKQAFLLSDQQRQPLPVQRLNPLDVSIRVPAAAPDPADSVVALEVVDAVASDPVRLLAPDGVNVLRAFDGQLNGRGIAFGPGKTKDAYVQRWTKTDETVSWPVRLDTPVTFEVTISFDAEAASAGGTYIVHIGEGTLQGTVTTPRGRPTLGRVRLQPGSFEIRVGPTEIKGGELMRLRSITLTPVKDNG